MSYLPFDDVEQRRGTLYFSVNYLVRLKERMRKKQFPPDGPHLALTENVYEGVQHLYLNLLNRSASGNVRLTIPAKMHEAGKNESRE